MTKWKELKKQILAGTMEDSQGESNTKEFLESLCASFNSREQIPLGQQHDLSKEAIGYINNFAVVPSNKYLNHWDLVGDVYFHNMDIDDALRGFSYSVNVDMIGDLERKEVAAYVPYPHYQDTQLLENISNLELGIVAGAWKKKSADPVTVSLIISFLLFIAAPAYNNLWNKKIMPVFAGIHARLGKKHKIAFMQVCEGLKGESFGVYFVPRNDGNFIPPIFHQVIDALEMVQDHLQSDNLAAQKGVYLVKVQYSNKLDRYALLSVEYLDGSVINHQF